MSLEDTLANMSLYDAKKYFRKAQNMMYNYTDMEAKVREATNNEPWGCSSTLMEQIAQGTYNIREREEILGLLTRRFVEKSGAEWRQIYKALQLVDYLVRHGSERFIDDLRQAIRLLELLESFHYIDSEGRDQGVNVRNRAQQITHLLRDDAMVRQERKKARETAQKYKGVQGGAGTSVMGAGAGPDAMNPGAGFTKSNRAGLSVSADFDRASDDEREYVAPGASKHVDKEQFSFGTGASAPSTAAAASASSDDEFADFQSAAPVAQAQEPAATSLMDFGDFATAAPAASAPTPAVAAPAPVVPAIAAANVKKSDPFSSLFDTAKTDKTEKPKPKPSAKASVQDDIFGDMASATPAKPATPAQDDDFGEMTSAQPAAQSQGDLLDLI
ncbi:Ent3 protein [Maudiozyma humilis]|uniref:Ent3 protein n=1 Tax=Maudiozyma humilis TaxID=51915 RepID=A0AAV5S1M5_MAUHU|nr:Ent3 protein [Kazachstania humilis]